MLAYQFAAVLAACVIVQAWPLLKKHPLLGLAWIWFAFSSLRVWALPMGGDSFTETALDSVAAQSFCWLALVGVTGAYLPFKRGFFGAALACLNAALLIGGAAFGKPWGLLLNASMSGCLAVVLLALCFSGPMLGLTAVAVLCTRQSQPIAGLFILLWLPVARARNYWASLLLPVLAVLTGYFVVRSHPLFDSDGRVSVWLLTLDWAKEHGNALLWSIGFGAGSFRVVGPALTNQQFIWLHNDWAQVLFEQGAVGLGLLVAVFIYLLRLTWDDARLSNAIILYGVWGIANMPLRYPLTAVLGSMLLRESLKD